MLSAAPADRAKAAAPAPSFEPVCFGRGRHRDRKLLDWRAHTDGENLSVAHEHRPDSGLRAGTDGSCVEEVNRCHLTRQRLSRPPPAPCILWCAFAMIIPTEPSPRYREVATGHGVCRDARIYAGRRDGR